MTNVASRTPEGQPNLCPLCGAVVCIILEDLRADSLDTAELVMALEEEGIVIPDDQAGQLKTIADVIAFIKSSRDRLT